MTRAHSVTELLVAPEISFDLLCTMLVALLMASAAREKTGMRVTYLDAQRNRMLCKVVMM